MKRNSLTVLLVIVSSIVLAQNLVRSNQWAATDALGRKVSDYSITGGKNMKINPGVHGRGTFY